MTEMERFMSKVSPEPNTGCWLYEGARSGGKPGSNYSVFWYNNKKKYAHRRAIELFKGEDTTGRLVTHNCDNQICVNPDHLKLGTYSSNLQEAWDRGRQPKRPAWNKGQRK